jgi:hypothetical protein
VFPRLTKVAGSGGAEAWAGKYREPAVTINEMKRKLIKRHKNRRFGELPIACFSDSALNFGWLRLAENATAPRRS